MRSRSSMFLQVLFAGVLLAATLAGCSAVATQQPKPAPSATSTPQAARPADDGKIDRATSTPYTGDLSIFEDPERDKHLQVERVMDVLGIQQGTNVADIGAGSGWFTVRAARRAGAGGTVYAVDINGDYLKYIEARAAKENLSNVRTVLGKEDDPALPDKSVDAVLILKTYHEIAQPVRRDVVVAEAARAGFALSDEYDFVKGDGMDYFLIFHARDDKK